LFFFGVILGFLFCLYFVILFFSSKFNFFPFYQDDRNADKLLSPKLSVKHN